MLPRFRTDESGPFPMPWDARWGLQGQDPLLAREEGARLISTEETPLRFSWRITKPFP